MLALWGSAVQMADVSVKVSGVHFGVTRRHLRLPIHYPLVVPERSSAGIAPSRLTESGEGVADASIGGMSGSRLLSIPSKGRAIARSSS